MSANHENDPVKVGSTDPSSTDFALEHPKPAILRTTISREKQLLKQHQQNQVLAFSEPKKHKSKSKANKITAQNQTKNKPTPTIANLDFDVSQQLLSLLLPFERQSSKYDLWVELALLSKVYRKYRFQQRNSINFKKLEQVRKNPIVFFFFIYLPFFYIVFRFWIK
ncbi:hypothetical protein AX774_g8048 [Zancudomyces culisetae]|uniref:Uncharacterized protein n=1 Tax=Zancudomyces culisetae TaxID=1213189 RepID=A0A1R1PCB4_ZANCU|nr:hypothetical protein AX774_g8048 [Zancudomyces culisetae]|eukprot:OMH78559.1 hypothetical protein AX774_g8048 [Zancudomyces culisetae]